jgi:hypothetical protein
MKSNKTPGMENVLDSLAKVMFGRGRQDSMDASICVSCGAKVIDAVDPRMQLIDGAMPFRDYLSLKEYGLSGLCMKCQDGVFGCGEPEEEELNDDVDPL